MEQDSHLHHYETTLDIWTKKYGVQPSQQTQKMQSLQSKVIHKLANAPYKFPPIPYKGPFVQVPVSTH